jgi:cyanophycinase
MRSVLVVLVLGCSLGLASPARAQSERFRGLWEGMFHGGRGDQPMALVVRPRGATGFAGTWYQEGMELGPVESARVSGDSLSCSLMSFDIVGVRSGEHLSVDFTVRNGKTHHFEMTRTSADTTRLPARAPAPARPAPRLVREEPPDSVYRIHTVPPGQAVSLAPCLRHGTLFLVGGGPSQADLDRRFVELAGGQNARVVVIPTAAIDDGDPDRLERFAESLRGSLGLSHVTMLHTTSRREADSEAFVAPLRQATGVWILGGEGSWLLDSYLGTRTERELIGVLERGGVVGGTSAGAVIWGSTLMTFRQDTTRHELQPMRVENLVIGNPSGVGIGLLRNMNITPHLSSFHLEPALRKLVAETPGVLGIGIDEATALEVHGDIGRVLGRGDVTIFPDGTVQAPVVLKDGARYDLAQRKTL